MENDWAIVDLYVQGKQAYMAVPAAHLGSYLRGGGQAVPTAKLTKAQAFALRDLLNSGEGHGS